MIKQKLTYVCNYCGYTVSESCIIAIGASARSPSLPNGWIQIGADSYCDQHNITVGVDSATLLMSWNQCDSIRRRLLNFRKGNPDKKSLITAPEKI